MSNSKYYKWPCWNWVKVQCKQVTEKSCCYWNEHITTPWMMKRKKQSVDLTISSVVFMALIKCCCTVRIIWSRNIAFRRKSSITWQTFFKTDEFGFFRIIKSACKAFVRRKDKNVGVMDRSKHLYSFSNLNWNNVFSYSTFQRPKIQYSVASKKKTFLNLFFRIFMSPFMLLD